MKLGRLTARLRASDDEDKQRRRQEQREHQHAIAEARGRKLSPAAGYQGMKPGGIAARAYHLARAGKTF
jgi:hypothetical protein